MTTTGEGKAKRRGFETTGDMVRSLLLVLVLVFVVVALTVRPHPDSVVHRFDYSGALAQAQDQAPLRRARADRAAATRGCRPAPAPPARATAVSWHVGFVTPADDYAALEQSDGSPAAFVRQFSGGGKPAGSEVIGGSDLAPGRGRRPRAARPGARAGPRHDRRRG